MRYRFMRFPEGKFKAVTFSYDDGVNQDIRLSELLLSYGLKGTFNINSELLGAPGRFSKRLIKEEIQEHILDKGHEVAVHGARHIASALASPALCTADALECRESLEDTFGIIIRGMAYPDSGIRREGNGNSYETVARILKDVGIVYSRTLGGDNDGFLVPTDWYAWMPTAHHNNSEIFNWIEKFNAITPDSIGLAAHYPRLFYIWGHSYEFDRDSNWDRIEKIAEMLASRPDTYYGTNIEICEYAMAYDSLIFSLDETIVYNPTRIKVWFEADGCIYSISPGETLYLK